MESVLFAGAKSGDDVWYIGYNQDMAREFINDCGKWAEKINKVGLTVEETLLKDEDRDILTYRIKLSSGHRYYRPILPAH